MATLAGQIAPLFDADMWATEVLQLLEEHHLVAWAHSPTERARFAKRLTRHLRGIEDTHVCCLDGEAISDLPSFCAELGRALGEVVVQPRITGRGGIVDMLRGRGPSDGRADSPDRPIKRRFYLWSGADVLLRHDHLLFGDLVDALAGVAAEAEYACEDLLLIHRAVFVGAPSLDVYAENPSGQFCSWAAEGDEVPLWKVVSGLPHPPFLRYWIESGA